LSANQPEGDKSMKVQESTRNRRGFALASMATAMSLAFTGSAALAQAPKDVKVAVVVPLSGPWARNGELHVKGAQAAIDDINAAGGVKALGGAKLQLVTVDAGESVEKARAAAQRLMADEPDLVGATGAFLSSFTLAVTEITERAKLPFLTLSYSDQITNRGFKYVFQTSPTANQQAADALPILLKLSQQATDKKATSVGLVMDNTASPVSFTKDMRESGFAKEGLKLTVDEIYTPPMVDATSVVQKLRNQRPNFVFMLATNVPDSKLILEKMTEMRIGKGVVPVVTNGGALGAPEMLKVMNKENLEGVMVVIANWPGKGQEGMVESFKKKFNEPWMTQDSISSYGDMWILKDAMEKAKSADRVKVADAIRAMDTTEGAAKYFPGGRIKFDEKGRRVGAETVILQWRNGEPKPVYPASLAAITPLWPK
jgi:branched-chain amino acid transport system substrate-binding protein